MTKIKKKKKLRQLSMLTDMFSILFQLFDGINDNALQKIPLDIYR